MNDRSADIKCLSTYEYNRARLLTVLEGVAIDRGAKVVNASRHNKDLYGRYKVYIINSSILPQIVKLKPLIHNPAFPNARSEYERLLSIDNSPQMVTHLSNIEFVYNGYFYGLSFGWSVFESAHYMRSKLVDENTIPDAFYQEVLFPWDNAAIVRDYQLDLPTLKRMACYLFDSMVASTVCSRIDTKRIRVHNIFDSGYHEECVMRTMRLFYL